MASLFEQNSSDGKENISVETDLKERTMLYIQKIKYWRLVVHMKHRKNIDLINSTRIFLQSRMLLP